MQYIFFYYYQLECHLRRHWNKLKLNFDECPLLLQRSMHSFNAGLWVWRKYKYNITHNWAVTPWLTCFCCQHNIPGSVVQNWFMLVSSSMVVRSFDGWHWQFTFNYQVLTNEAHKLPQYILLSCNCSMIYKYKLLHTTRRTNYDIGNVNIYLWG